MPGSDGVRVDGLLDAVNEFPPDQIRLRSYLYILSVAILYYDHLLTLGDEVQYMWFQGRNFPWLFFMNRYFSILADIGLTTGQFITYDSIPSCITYSAISETCLVIAQTIVSVVLLMRTYALYNRSLKILVFILVVSSGLLGVCIWALLTRKTGLRSINSHGCTIVETPSSELHMAAAWEALIAYDIMIFTTIVFKTYKVTHQPGFRRGSGRLKNLIELVFRDGAIYFVVMAFANIANTITFYTLPPVLKGCLARFTSSISVTLVSRLILNLRIRAVQRNSESFDGEGTSMSFQMTSRIPSDMFTDFYDSSATRGGRITSMIMLQDSRTFTESIRQ